MLYSKIFSYKLYYLLKKNIRGTKEFSVGVLVVELR